MIHLLQQLFDLMMLSFAAAATVAVLGDIPLEHALAGAAMGSVWTLCGTLVHIAIQLWGESPDDEKGGDGATPG